MIQDLISGQGKVTLAWHFHLAPELSANLTATGACEVLDERGQVLLRLQPQGTGLKARVARGETLPLLGWASRTSATVLPTSVVVYSTTVTLPWSQSFELAISLHPASMSE